MIASDAIALNGMWVRLPLEAPPSVCQLAEQSNLKFDGCTFESSQMDQIDLMPVWWNAYTQHSKCCVREELRGRVPPPVPSLGSKRKDVLNYATGLW